MVYVYIMTDERTPKQRVIEKLVKEIGEFTSDKAVAVLATKILSSKVNDTEIRYIRDKLGITKGQGNLKNTTVKHVGLDYRKNPNKTE